MREGYVLALCMCAMWFVSCRDKCVSCSNYQFGPPLGFAVSAVGAELIFFDMRDHAVKGAGGLQGWAMACEISMAGQQLLAADNESASLAIYDLPGLELDRRLSMGGVPMDLRLNRSGLTVHMITRNGFYYRIALSDLEVDTLEVGLQLRRLRMRPHNDQEAWISSTGEGALRVVQEQGFEELEPIYPPAGATDLCFSPDGASCFAALPGAGIVWQINADTRDVMETYSFSGGPVDVDISHDGRFLAAADSASGALKIWDLPDGLSYVLQCGTRVMKPKFAETFESLYVICPAESFVLRVDLSGEEPAVADTFFCAPTPYALALWE